MERWGRIPSLAKWLRSTQLIKRCVKFISCRCQWLCPAFSALVQWRFASSGSRIIWLSDSALSHTSSSLRRFANRFLSPSWQCFTIASPPFSPSRRITGHNRSTSVIGSTSWLSLSSLTTSSAYSTLPSSSRTWRCCRISSWRKWLSCKWVTAMEN